MVQVVMTDILVIQGQPFEAFYNLATDINIEDVSTAFEVEVTKDNETVLEFIPGAGAALSTRENQVVLVLSAADTSEFPLGLFQYSISLQNRDSETVLSVSGDFRVVPAPEGMVPTVGAVRPWDLLNPSSPRADKQLRSERMEICRACPELLAGFCKKCGCRMKWKTTLLDATCPLGKW